MARLWFDTATGRPWPGCDLTLLQVGHGLVVV